jgi:hypothetical protein
VNPAPGLLSDWITIPGFLWFVLACIVATYLAIFIVQLVRVWKEDDAAKVDAQDDHVQQQVARYHCAGNGHKYMQEGDQWLCACGDVVRRGHSCGGFHRYETQGRWLLCTVCGYRTALPYDHEASA